MPLDAIERKQAKAVQFLRDVADDPDKADEFESMSPEEYAEHKSIKIVANPYERTIYCGEEPVMNKQEMEERIAELEESNEDLQSRLDSIIDIVQPGDEAADEDGEEMDSDDLDGEDLDEDESDFGDEDYEAA
jgi:hypothetical protein